MLSEQNKEVYNIRQLEIRIEDKKYLAIYNGFIFPVKLFEAINMTGLAAGLRDFFAEKDIETWASDMLEKTGDDFYLDLWNEFRPKQAEAKLAAETEYEEVNGPAHYDGDACLREMVTAFGAEATKYFCVCNAWKYRYRAGRKPGQEASKDGAKAKFYMDYAKRLDEEMRGL